MTHESSPKLDLGQVGERVVSQWLRSEGFTIQDERWHCRFGELDIVALEPEGGEQTLAFIEVKARQAKNWDSDGAMAITPTKQRKLIKAAQLYLGSHPRFEHYPCRFDVALVQIINANHEASRLDSGTNKPENDLHWVNFGNKRLRLKRYIRSAFETG